MTPQTVNNNQSTIINANTFTKSNAVFTGWNTNVNGTGTSYMDKASITISNNITLYAQWKQGTPLKVASFNVGYFRCGSSTSISCRPSYSDIADLIKNYQLDIVGMQEVRDPFLNSDGSPNNSYIQTIKNRLNYYGYWVDAGQNVNAIISKYQFDVIKTESNSETVDRINNSDNT